MKRLLSSLIFGIYIGGMGSVVAVEPVSESTSVEATSEAQESGLSKVIEGTKEGSRKAWEATSEFSKDAYKKSKDTLNQWLGDEEGPAATSDPATDASKEPCDSKDRAMKVEKEKDTSSSSEGEQMKESEAHSPVDQFMDKTKKNVERWFGDAPGDKPQSPSVDEAPSDPQTQLDNKDTLSKRPAGFFSHTYQTAKEKISRWFSESSDLQEPTSREIHKEGIEI